MYKIRYASLIMKTSQRILTEEHLCSLGLALFGLCLKLLNHTTDLKYSKAYETTIFFCLKK